ncbi:response regulator transcription factor [Streptomyces olivaceus]|uniref:helix-turn-helix transcriptional regulator n=1 Tax=Streptomyces olivaceus TaxID=47716 RepID=UPI0033A207EF
MAAVGGQVAPLGVLRSVHPDALEAPRGRRRGPARAAAHPGQARRAGGEHRGRRADRHHRHERHAQTAAARRRAVGVPDRAGGTQQRAAARARRRRPGPPHPPPDRTAAGDALLAPGITRRPIAEFSRLDDRPRGPLKARVGDLTGRETEVLALIAQGLSDAEIAQRPVVAEQTVKTRVGRVLVKLGLRDRTQAAVFVYESGLVRPSGY